MSGAEESANTVAVEASQQKARLEVQLANLMSTINEQHNTMI